MTNIEIQALWSLCTIFSLRMLGIFIVLPVLTTYGMELHGANESLIGVAIGIYGLAQAIFQIPFGLLSDKIGRKPLIILGSLIFAIGSLIAALMNNIFGVIIGRALQGSGTITAVIIALLSDLIREQNRTKAMAFIGVSFGITFTLSIVISPIITYAIGLKGLFLSTFILTLISIILTLLIVPSVNESRFDHKWNITRRCFNTILINSQLLKLNIGIFCLHSILMLNFISLPYLMVINGFLPHEQWKVYLITMLISFIITMPMMIYAEKKQCIKYVFISGIMILLFSELVLLLSKKGPFWIILTGIQLFFISFNLMEALLPSLISKEAPEYYKGTAMGIYSTYQFLGIAFGGIIGGFLSQWHGMWLVLLAGEIITLVWLVISITLREPPYVTTLFISKNNKENNMHFFQSLYTEPGIIKVIMIDNKNISIKVDMKKIKKEVLEKIIEISS